MIYFIVPPRVITSAPIGNTTVYFESDVPTECVQCKVCHQVWESNPPSGHACFPPLDPKLAWPA